MMNCKKCNSAIEPENKSCPYCEEKVTPTQNGIKNNEIACKKQSLWTVLDEELQKSLNSSKDTTEELADTAYIKKINLSKKSSLSDKINSKLLNKKEKESIYKQVNDPNYARNIANHAYLFIIISIIFSLTIYLSILGLIFSIVAINKADYVERLCKANDSANSINCKMLNIFCKIALFLSFIMIIISIVLVTIQSILI